MLRTILLTGTSSLWMPHQTNNFLSDTETKKQVEDQKLLCSSRTTHPGSWKPASQWFSINMGQTKEWSAQHPYLATRNWILEHGGKGALRIRDSLLEDVNKNGCPEWTWESPSDLNVLYKSFHVHRNMSSFWSFPLKSFAAVRLSRCSQMVWRCMWSRGCCGGGRIIFSSHGDLSPLTDLYLFFQEPSGTSEPTHSGPGPQESPLFTLCVQKFSVSTSAFNLLRWHFELLPTCYLIHKLWLLVIKNPSPWRREEFHGISCSLLSHLPYGQLVFYDPTHRHHVKMQRVQL